MTDDRVRVSRTVYRNALDLAIEYQLSRLATHDLIPCCTSEDRCEIWKSDNRLLGDFRRARKALGRELEIPGKNS